MWVLYQGTILQCAKKLRKRPRGDKKIAQHVSAGYAFEDRDPSPVGTTERYVSAVPAELYPLPNSPPALTCWSIFLVAPTGLVKPRNVKTGPTQDVERGSVSGHDFQSCHKIKNSTGFSR